MRWLMLTLLLSSSLAAQETFRVCGPAGDCRCQGASLPLEEVRIKLPANRYESAVRCGALSSWLPQEYTRAVHVEGPCAATSQGAVTSPSDLLRRLEGFPENCGYRMQGFNAVAFRQTIATFVAENRVLCGGAHHAMCTSAVMLAFLHEARRWRDEGRISDDTLAEWSRLDGPVYQAFNFATQPDRLVEELGVGVGASFTASQLPQADWPRRNDFVQIWRRRPPLSGHSVVAAGDLLDAAGAKVGLCYWSANLATDGYGLQCERYEFMERILIGRLTQ